MKITKATMRVKGADFQLIYVEPNNPDDGKCLSVQGYRGEGGDWENSRAFDFVSPWAIKGGLEQFIYEVLTGDGIEDSDLAPDEAFAELGLSPSQIKVEKFEI